jgi:hypothetical protein
MAIKFKCICGASLETEESQAGQRMTCSKCAASLVIPVPPLQRGPAIKIDMKDLDQVAPRPTDPLPPSKPPASVPERVPLDEQPITQTTMRANRRLEGKVCSVCQAKIKLGEELRLCEHCRQPFHQACWEENGGCGTYGCEGAKSTKPKQSFADFSVPRDQVSATSYAKQAGGTGAEYSSPRSYPSQGPIAPLATARTSGMAIASLVLGLVWICGLGSLLAVIFGHVALADIERGRGQVLGRGMAIAGLILGYLGLLLLLLQLLGGLAALSSH